MRALVLVRSRWLMALAGVAAIVLLAGCGRVNLEDLTPEAVRTQQAIDAAAQPTAANTAEPGSTAEASGTEGAGGPAAPQGDVAAGYSIYNSQCSGCHEGTRASSLRGRVFDPAVEIPKLRTGEGFGVPHPKYSTTDIRPLNENDFNDVFAFLASE